MSQLRVQWLRSMVAVQVDIAQLREFELCLYDTQPAALSGARTIAVWQQLAAADFAAMMMDAQAC